MAQLIVKFKYGFEYKGFVFGWKDKELYRLPSSSGRNNYVLKKLKKITVGNKMGYRIKRDKLTVEQLEQKTILINKEIQKITDKDLPF